MGNLKDFVINGMANRLANFEVEYVESMLSGHVRHTRGQKARRHCKRWWWAYAILVCVSILIIVLCLVYVALPKISQRDLNESTLSFSSLKLVNPTGEYITIAAAAVIHSSSIFTPTVEPFNATMHLVNNGYIAPEAITEISMPSVHSHRPDTNITISLQQVPIMNLDQVTALAVQLLNEPTVTIQVEGNTKLHEGALPVSDIIYNSSITFQGLNGLPGFSIINPMVNPSASPGEPNIIGTAVFPNPTIVTVELGVVTLSISTANEGLIGNCTVSDFTLRPGDNHMPISVLVNTSLALQSTNSDGMLDLIIVGQTSTYNGVHLLYYEKALQSHTINYSLNISAILSSAM